MKTQSQSALARIGFRRNGGKRPSGTTHLKPRTVERHSPRALFGLASPSRIVGQKYHCAETRPRAESVIDDNVNANIVVGVFNCVANTDAAAVDGVYNVQYCRCYD